MSKYVNAAEAADKISKKLNIPMNKLVDIFAEIPRADVKEVKHGKWIDSDNDYTVAKCSVCGEEFDAVCPIEYAGKEFWDEFENSAKYCSNCGAKMNGGDDE